MTKHLIVLGTLAALSLAFVPSANALIGPPNSTDCAVGRPETVGVNCMTTTWYCSPNDPSQYPGANCENGIWMSHRSFCTLVIFGQCQDGLIEN